MAVAPVETLLIVSEMGLGDTLSMARFVPEAAKHCRNVIFEIQPELVGFLHDAFPENVKVIAQSHVLPQADAWCAAFSLPHILGLTTDQIATWPGLDPTKLNFGDTDFLMPKDKFNIVIAFAGSPHNDIDKHRSIPPEQFLALREVPGVKLWSVQVGPRVKELHEAGLAALLVDVSPLIRDCRDTAAIIRAADLVICCESFVGHLCGALEKECWVLCSRLGRDWRTGSHGDKTLWYDNTRLFRQDDRRAWAPVFTEVVAALKERVNAPPRNE